MEINNVFVIIVSYNGKQWYDHCFESLRMSEIPLQTIVIDNASSDDTITYIKENYPEIILIESDRNLGFGQANNIGMRYALDRKADYVFLLNQDAWIEPNTIRELINIHKKHSEYGILSPLHLNAEKTSIEAGLLYYIADYKTTDKQLINDLYFGKLKELYDTKYVNAAAWLLPRRTLEVVGGFDPIFFHYGEDDNYMQRVLFHGMKIGLCPKIKIVHDTERRIIKKEFIEATRQKCLLVNFTDVNDNQNLYKYILLFCRRILKKMLGLNFKQAKQLYLELAYILNLKKQITLSKVQNEKKTSSWL